MRRSAADYLEEAKLEELVAELEQRGYHVTLEAPLGDQRIDLLAERDGERFAYEVKAQSRLKESSEQLERLRAAALAAGLNGFRVVVAVPPHVVDVTIENLRSELRTYLAQHALAATACQPYPVMKVDDVIDVVIDAVGIHPSRVNIRGQGYVDVQVDDGGGQRGFAIDSYPFTFDLDLDPDLKIMRVHSLDIASAA